MIAISSNVPQRLAGLVIGVLGVLFLSTLGLSLSDNKLAILAFCVLSAPLMVFWLSQALAWREPYSGLFCVVLIVLLTSIFRIRDIDDKSIDTQILVKLACLSLIALMVFSAHWRRDSFLNCFSNLSAFALFIAYMSIEVAISVQPSIAAVEASSNIMTVLFLKGILDRLGTEKFFKIILSACVCMCLMSFVAYFLFPDFGRMTDWEGDSFVVTSRLQGVFGTANGAGAAAAYCLLITIIFRRSTDPQWLNVTRIGLFVGVLMLSNNRMAFVASGVAVIFYFLNKSKSFVLSILLIMFSLIVVLVFDIYGDQMLSLVARSGSADEISSGTGRTQIWSVVIDLWLQRPILGYGVGSAKFILPHQPLLFAAAAHAHSMYFNILFAGGAVGFGLLIFNIASIIGRARLQQNTQILTLVLFFLLYGITESVVGGVPSFESISFFSVLLLGRRDHRFRGLEMTQSALCARAERLAPLYSNSGSLAAGGRSWRVPSSIRR